MATYTWLLLIYKVPPEPASKRVALWRRLKSMGAVYLQNGVCLLPKTDDHARRLKMLANDIAEMSGEAVILEAIALDRAQQEKVVSRFTIDRDDAYREFIDKYLIEYDSNGNEIRCDSFSGGSARSMWTNQYVLDSIGNWIKRTRHSTGNSKRSNFCEATHRVIEYAPDPTGE